jgi:hypothetical protein
MVVDAGETVSRPCLQKVVWLLPSPLPGPHGTNTGTTPLDPQFTIYMLRVSQEVRALHFRGHDRFLNLVFGQETLH